MQNSTTTLESNLAFFYGDKYNINHQTKNTILTWKFKTLLQTTLKQIPRKP